MFEIEDLYDIALEGAFSDREEFLQFAKDSSKEDLYSMMQEGSFSNQEEFNSSVNFFLHF